MAEMYYHDHEYFDFMKWTAYTKTTSEQKMKILIHLNTKCQHRETEINIEIRPRILNFMAAALFSYAVCPHSVLLTLR